MSRRYENSAGVRFVPPSYQPELIPMRNGYGQPSQAIPRGSQYRTSSPPYNTASFKNNRGVPPSHPQDHQTYFQSNNSLPLSITPTKPFIRTSGMYPQKQPPMNRRYSGNPNRPYDPHHNPTSEGNNYPYDDFEQNSKSTAWVSKDLCFGLTYLSGGILFGSMILLAVAALGGLIATVVVYSNDMTTDAQWKILGMVVCSVMLLTILITLLIFFYCYKKGHIVLNNNRNSSVSPLDNQQRNGSIEPYNYNQGDTFRRPSNYQQPHDRSVMPYGHGMIENTSPLPTYENTIEVDDKQTNTESTISALRPRDYKRGVWPAMNAFGGVSHRPLERPKLTHHLLQVYPNDIDQSMSQRKNQPTTILPSNSNRQPANYIPYGGEQRSNRFIPPQPKYDVIEEIYETPRRRKPEEYVEIIELPKPRREPLERGLAKSKHGNILIKHVKTIEEPHVQEDNFNTDHFYK